MILPLRVFGSVSVNLDASSGFGEGSDFFCYPLAQVFFQFFRGLSPLLERYECGDGLAFQFIGTADHSGFRHGFMRYQRRFHFHGAGGDGR